LKTDASDIGIGAVLKQNDKAIVYASRVLNKTERNYSITDKETLAALWGMEYFKYYLIGKLFTIITDHQVI
jgi:hypothetical protein